MTKIKNRLKYLIASMKRICYDLNNRRVKFRIMEKEKNYILDAKTLACYIKEYYKNNQSFPNGEISPIKLQKALYFCFAYWGGFIRKNKSFSDEVKEINFNYNEILFPNRIEAWVYGPVVPDVYHSDNLNDFREEDPFDGNKYIEEFINNILDDVLKANDFKLVDVSHQDKCWQKNFKPNSKFHNCVIPPEEIISEYAKNY